MSAVIILGGTGTIGSSLARRLVARHEEVVIVGRSQERLRRLGDEIHQPVVLTDFRSSAYLESELSQVADRTNGFHGVVNCIGSLLLKPAHATSDGEFREMLEVNLFSAFCAVRLGAKFLRDDGGSIVLIGSAAAELGIANHEAIAAAKAGIAGLARSAAATYAPHNIRVNVVNPGLVESELTQRICDNPVARSASTSMHPLGRIGKPEHVASLIDWLLLRENDWITGQAIGVDGGLAHLLPRR